MLVVEDEPGAQSILEQLLAGEAHEAVPAADGVAALAAATRGASAEITRVRGAGYRLEEGPWC